MPPPPAKPFQVASLVNAPSFPNAVVWSDDNLLAVATGDIVTILNPDNVQGTRGVITLSAGMPFPVGVIDRADLVSGCLLPTCLARDRQPCVRSLSWSPVGYTPSNGCLLAVCSAEGRVKVYREPSFEYQAEWIEVIDISDVLHGYFAKINYREPASCSTVMDNSASQMLAENAGVSDKTTSTSTKASKRIRVDDVNLGDPSCTEMINPTYDTALCESNMVDVVAESVVFPSSRMQECPAVEVVVNRTSKAKENNASRIARATKSRNTSNKRTLDSHTDHVLTAHQYASRSSMLASLVVTWSPALQLSANDSDDSCDSFCLLAVGTKSGTISIWKCSRPSYYSVEHHDDPIHMTLVDVLHAHSGWVTALSWGLLASDSSPQILLASGCSDCSTKIWLAHVCDFERSFETNQTPFSLFSEITVGDKSLVSTLSLHIPAQSPKKILLAVGKGSGSFDVWSLNRETKSPKKVGSCNAHIHPVTGLAWSFDGRCLYSCSQDNSLYGWIHHKGALFQAPIPPNNLGTRSSSDLPSVSDSSYGVAVSPSNLALAVARRFDAGQLDHMYQKRTQRAAVEFFWIGGQEFNMPLHINLKLYIAPGFTKEELVSWGSKLLWSLNKFESCDKHLIAWDLLAAMLSFKECAPEFIKHLILSWLKLLLEGYLDSSTNGILSVVPQHMSQISSRQLHLLNILCRRVILSSGCHAAKISAKPQKLAKLFDMEEEGMWLNVMSNTEKELRERLVGLSLSTALVLLTNPAPKVGSWLWKPIGIAQMVKWVMQNQDHVHHKLNLLAREVKGHASRLHSVCDYMIEEHCCFCSAAIPFESPEAAICEGVLCGEGEAPQNHKLTRCSVSMQVCPLTQLWICTCCQRRASNLPPHQLHEMVGRPSDFGAFVKSVVNRLPYPLCLFCGISLQRLQPDFLLSKSPV